MVFDPATHLLSHDSNPIVVRRELRPVDFAHTSPGVKGVAQMRRFSSVVLCAALVVSVLIASPLTFSSDAADAVEAPTPPTSVALKVDHDTFAAGSQSKLTATADVDVSGGAPLKIMDITTGTAVTSCASGMTCSASVSFYAGGAHEYQATIGSLVSEAVSVSRAPWTVGLVADQTGFMAGQSPTLTATANQNVGLTGSNYRILIWDKTSGGLLAACTSGTSCVVRTQFYTGNSHTYYAVVAAQNGLDSQATSNEIQLARAPWTVSLTTDQTVFSAGESPRLTATTNQDVGSTGSSYRILIYDKITGGLLAVCVTGTSCSVRTQFYTGATHSYYAVVAAQNGQDVQATSNEVQLSRAPWEISLVTDLNTYAAGQSPLLTATANQDVGSTGSNYRILIYDKTTGGLLASCVSTNVCSVRALFYTGGSHTYYGVVAAPNGQDIQASSNEVQLSRAPWTVSLRIEQTVFYTGESPLLTATTNQDVGSTGSSYRILVYDKTTGGLLAVCLSGTSCTIRTQFYTGATHTYYAVIAAPNGQDIQATSNEVQLSRAQWTVSLTASQTSFAAGESPLLSATSNQDVGSTGSSYRILIFDKTTGGLLAVCLSGKTCAVRTQFYTGAPHSYYAVIATPSGQDVQATSNVVQLARVPWSVSLTVDKTVFAAGESPRLTATSNQDVGSTGSSYRILIFDRTSGALIASCVSGTTCTTKTQFYTGGPHTYYAVVAAQNGQDIQATSNEVQLARAPWIVSMTASTSGDAGSNPATRTTKLTAVANQDVGLTGSSYRLTIVDWTSGSTIASCVTGASCVGSASQRVSTPSHLFVALIAQPNGSDVQANSRGYSADLGTGAILPGETTGGSNPAEKACQCHHADPVNTATGEFFLSSTDLSLDGAGPSMAVERTYSTTNALVAGAFGFGWSTGLSSRLAVLVPGDTTASAPRQVRVTQENGSTLVFSLGPDGSYVAPPRVLATLIRSADTGAWTFTRQSRLIMNFGANGALTRIADLNGTSVDFTRNAAGQIDHLSGSGGRSIGLTWANDRITQASDGAGRVVSYGYTGGVLTSVTAVDGRVTQYRYNSGLLMSQIVKPGGGLTTNTYDDSGRVTTQTDPLGRVTSFAYTTSGTTITRPDGTKTNEVYTAGRLTSKTEGAGTSDAATTSYLYDDASNIVQTVDPVGAVTMSTYDASGNRLTATDPLGLITTFTYDSLQNVISSTNAIGQVSSFTYDARGNLTGHTDPSGATEQWAVGADGRPTSRTDSGGGVSTYQYNARGQLTSTTDPDGVTQTSAYNAAGFTSSTTDGAGGVTAFQTDAAGRILVVTDSLGNATATTYDADGNPTTVTGPDGAISRATFDASGQKLTATDAAGAVTTYTYSPGGQVASKKDGRGKTTRYTYTARNQLATTTDPLGNSLSYSYDLAGRQTKASLPSGASTSSSFDLAGNVTSRTDANGHKTTYKYDALNRLKSATDPAGRVTSTTYAPTGGVATVVHPDGSVDSYAYTSNGQVSSFTDAANAQTTYAYTQAGRTSTVTRPGGFVTTTSYDNAGRPSATTKPDGTVSLVQYDLSSRVTSVDYPGTTSDVGYTYDSAGRPVSVTDATGTSTYTYDPKGAITSLTNGAGANLSFTYDVNGAVKSIRYPDGRSVDYTYDDAGRMSALTDQQARTVSFEWTVDSQLAKTNMPNGVTETRAYDPAGQTTEIASSTASSSLRSFEYQYDSTGQVTTVGATSTSSPAQSTDYGHDLLNQITSVSGSGAYSATSTGQVTATPQGSALAYTGDRLTSLTTSAGAVTTYGYDDNGQRASQSMTSTPTTQYSYTPGGNLASAQIDGTTITYGYDSNGLRTSRAANGASTAQYTWSPVGAIPLLLGDGTNWFVYGPGSTPIEQISATTNASVFLHADRLGTVRALTNSSGQLVGTADYDAYGNLTAHTGSVSAIGFTGNLTDPSTGLVYLRARDYDPATLQFLTPDPLQDQTRTAYAYVHNNPLLFTDPTGMQEWYDAVASWMLNDGGWLTSAIVGFGDGASFGATAAVRQASDQAFGWSLECTFAHDGWYAGGQTTGMVASALLPFGAGAQAARSGQVAARAGEGVASSGSRVISNKAMGDAAADAIAARYPNAGREVTLQARSGTRRVDVLTDEGVSIESKVGRTSLTPAVRQQVERDVELLNDPASVVTSVEWHFGVSPVTGLGGPTGPLLRLLQESGIIVR